MLHIVQEDIIARLEVAVGHYYLVLMNCYTAGLPCSILKSFAEYYVFLIYIIARSMLFSLPIPQVLDLHLLVLLCHFVFVA
jgi:hypothetical protein